MGIKNSALGLVEHLVGSIHRGTDALRILNPSFSPQSLADDRCSGGGRSGPSVRVSIPERRKPCINSSSSVCTGGRVPRP